MSNPERSSATLLTSDKHRIAYRHYKTGHDQAVIVAHGFYNSKDAVLLQRLKDRLLKDFDVVMFDFRGHGKSSGLFSWTAKEDRDLEAVLSYVRRQYSSIGIVGFSVGGSIAVNVLARDASVQSLICVSSPSEMKKVEYRFWELDLAGDIGYTFGPEGVIGRGMRLGPFWLKKQKPEDSAKKLACPVLYIHGDRDWVVSRRHSERLYENTASKKELRIIKTGTHAEYLLRDHKEVFDWIRDWFTATLPKGGKA